jgi:hypothetical protein
MRTRTLRALPARRHLAPRLVRLFALLTLSALIVPAFAEGCACEEPPPDPPPLPIGAGNPTDPRDAGADYEEDAGPVACADDEHEDNDVRADAVDVVGGGPISGVVCGDDDDWFAVLSAPGCTVLAELTQARDGTSIGDIDLLLFDPDGQLVGSSASLGEREAINVPARKEGRYAVRLRAGARDTVPYSLVLTSTCANDLVCPDDDRLEDNDDPQTAAALNTGVAHDGIVCSGDEDWFVVPAATGCVADAQLSFAHAGGDIDLELYRPDGITRVAASASTTDDERILRVATEPGMLYRVRLFSGAGNTYRFVVRQICAGQIACPSDDPFEPNDERTRATLLFRDRDEAIGVICGNDDFYEVVPQQGCTLRTHLRFVHAEGDLDMELLDKATGNRLGVSNGTSDVEQIDFTAPNANRVVVRVHGFSAATNVYRLRIETSCE